MTEQANVSRTSVKPSETKPDKFPVRLLKNYVPTGNYEIIGHHRAAVVQKTAGGQMVEISPAAFVEGEMMPPPYPGAGGGKKIWAGTILRLPISEAKKIISQNIGVRADALPG